MASKAPDHEHREDEEERAADDGDTGAQFTPIAHLEEVAVIIGEENEDAILDLSVFFFCLYGELKDELFCIRFATVENCKTFMEKFQEIAETQKSEEENKEESAAAESLEKLSVEEKKAEDKAGEAVATKEEKETEVENTGKADSEQKDGEAASST
ncbi:Ran-binding protein 1-like protein b [Hibiscus syriacus]|uniref:Ran-binding protein 1-like protein b n=1 Tax=Hibiscus syriacus TaxID=106335 RepID=A0A6A2ZB18_HIBSY|nr:Ran-binding protein 1-like protein b [Hibiscus syriacus]